MLRSAKKERKRGGKGETGVAFFDLFGAEEERERGGG